MDVVRIASAGEFLTTTAEFRARESLGTNVIGSVALSVEAGSRRYDDAFWWTVTHDDEIVAIAMRTPPHALLLSPSSPGSSEALCAATYEVDPELPAVAGPKVSVEEFLAARAHHGDHRTATLVLREYVQVIETLVVPRVSGSARLAGAADVDLVVPWGHLFARDANIPIWSDDGLIANVNEGRLYLWIDGDEVVSMAGHAVPVGTPGTSLARVGPVFTPQDRRGRGYAAALTAHVTQILQDEGHRVMLHTDADNATSNGVYRRLGYDIVAENVRYEFTTSPAHGEHHRGHHVDPG